MTSICCVGEVMWDFRATPGEPLSSATTFERVPGGAACNVALALLAAGERPAVSGVVARDAFGRGLSARLDEAGIDVTALLQRRGRTGLVFIEHVDGQDGYLSYRPDFATSTLVLPQSWRSGSLEGRLLHLAALDPDWLAPDRYLALARDASGRGAKVSLDVNARPRAWRKRRGIPRPFRALLASADLVKASHEDLAMLGVSDDPEQARRELAMRGTLVVTRGPQSTVAVGAWGTARKKPARLTPRRTVGAGDAFCAALLLAAGMREHARAGWRVVLAQANEAAARWLTR